MRDSVRQVRALLVLLLRHFQRRALKAGANPRQSGVPSFLLLSLVWAAYVGNALWNLFVKAASDRSGPAEAIAWQLLGLTCMLVGFGLAELVPDIGKVKSPLRAALL